MEARKGRERGGKERERETDRQTEIYLSKVTISNPHHPIRCNFPKFPPFNCESMDGPTC
jgi:hypothetical protein